MTVMNTEKAEILKRRLKFAWQQWKREYESDEYGTHLTKESNPRISHLESKMPRLARELRELGDDCPPVPGEEDFK